MTTSTTQSPSGARDRSKEYRLAHEPDGRSWTARENLVDVLERELLGPAGGPEEVLDAPPDTVYLVGRIAPMRLSGNDDAAGTEPDDQPLDVDVEDSAQSRGVPVTAVDDSSPNAEEDDADDQPQKRGLMIPASMGLRFQVPLDLDACTVLASWGVYEPVKEEQGEAGTSGRRRYRRTPMEVRTRVRMADLMPGKTTSYPLHGDVVLRVDCHDDPAGGRRLVEVALCNDRATTRRIPVSAWLFQTTLSVDADGAEAFLPVRDPLEDTYEVWDDELRRLNLQYRDRLEFAHGRTCSVGWDAAEGSRRAGRVWTTWLPVCETRPTRAEEAAGALLDMTALAVADRAALESGLTPIVAGYAAWLDEQDRRADELPEHLRGEAHEAVAEARKVRQQLDDGLAHLLSDDEALRCFRFMNHVMADQRVHTQAAELRARNPKLTLAEARGEVRARGESAHSWRTFQLAFILMQLPSLTDPAAAKRSGNLARAQLLFFPTGGGKTEAYLGLAAYEFAIRRRQGIVDTPDGPLDGRSGVAVLMRYTLRLLTAQQFQRATALVCAAELARREDQATWGDEPFRIGLWVGTDVSPKRYEEAREQLKKVNEGRGYRLTVLQIQRCPWCGTAVDQADVRGDDTTRRIHVYCGDELADCPFAEGGTAGEGLPVLTVDEEIYRLTPAFVIATVDKFARLAREGEAASLFGYVSRRCDRHGYVHPDYRHCEVKDGSKHPAKNGVPGASVRPAGRLRPPDLIIQDELHLITGSLGTTVGLFEVAIDVMSSWTSGDGRSVRPLLIASTATARNSHDQVRALYGRGVTIFPPQVLDAGRTFFSTEVAATEEEPGRRYVGISTTGVRLTTAEIRVAEILMSGAQLLLDRSGDAADPYLTLVGYFSAVRELAGMARYLSDDVQTALAKGRPWSALPRRYGTGYGDLNTAELTSRVASADITGTLDQMGVGFDPDIDTTDARNERLALIRAGKQPRSKRAANPYDAVLATSMLQVGVDVPRLGLMLVVGQPKNTAEYIQATSRVGRVRERPGLVVTLGNWARPRDLAHFEQFRHYHETFYAQVEALSVTPFSVTAMERGLDAVLVSAARVLDASRVDGLSPERGADRVGAAHDFATALVEALAERIGRATDERSVALARNRLKNRLDQWVERRTYLAGKHKSLVYERFTDEAHFGPLIVAAEDAQPVPTSKDAPPFTVPNSMREVQPEINMLVSPIPANLWCEEPPTAPQWTPPQSGDNS